jgi:hypothetical protein
LNSINSDLEDDQPNSNYKSTFLHRRNDDNLPSNNSTSTNVIEHLSLKDKEEIVRQSIAVAPLTLDDTSEHPVSQKVQAESLEVPILEFRSCCRDIVAESMAEQMDCDVEKVDYEDNKSTNLLDGNLRGKESIMEVEFEIRSSENVVETKSNCNITIEQDVWCDLCNRTSTTFYPLILKQRYRREFSRMKKIFWTLPAKAQLNLCQNCTTFTTHGERDRWTCTWPAVLWCIFTSKINFTAVEALLQLLPYEIRFSYLVQSGLMSDSFRKLFDTIQPLCRDCTGLMNHFDDTMSSNKLVAPDFCRTIRQTSFPTTLCPMNCMMFPDFKSHLIPLHHYLRFIQEDFQLMNADASWFVGKNPAWPNILNISNVFECLPGITVSKELGICIISCSEAVHSIKSSKFLHPPISPIMELGSNRKDLFAKVVLVPHLARTAKVSSFNHSFRVVKLKASTIGMSCFQLQVNPDNIHTLTNEEEDMGAILMHTRPDVRDHMKDIIGSEECDRFQQRFQDLLATTTLGKQLADSSSHSSFLCQDHLLDFVALELRAEFRNNSTDIDDNDNDDIIDESNLFGEHEWVLKHVLYPILDNENFGKKSFVIPVEMMKGISGRNCIPLYTTLLEIFANVPEIFTSYLKQHYSIRKSIGKECLRIYRLLKNVQDRTPWKSSKVKCANFQKLENDIDANRALSSSENLLKWFEKNCNNNFVITNPSINFSFDDMVKLSDDDYSYCLVSNCFEFYNSINWTILKEANFYPIMFSKLHPTENGIKFLHRWSSTFNWQSDDYVPNSFKVFNNNSDLSTFIQQCDIIIFKRTSGSIKFLQREISKMLHIQDHLKCDKHNENLIPISGNIIASCCFKSCYNQPKLRCCHGFERNERCNIAVCLTHIHECKKLKDYPVYLPISNNLSTPDLDESQLNMKKIRKLAKEIEKRTTKAMTRKNGIIPYKYNDDAFFKDTVSDKGTMPGHYLTNTFMRIRSRAFKFKKPPIFTQTCLQRMNSSSTTNRSALIQPESDIFPMQFWYAFEKNSVAGALPFTLYKDSDTKHYRNSLASVNEHSSIRIRNGALWQSKCPNYRTWAFDILMNSRSQYYPIQQVLKKGPEILCPNETLDGFAVSLVEGVHTFNSGAADNHRGVNELAAMSRNSGAWRYFYTLTCNDGKTPGVAELYDRLKDLYGDNSEKYKEASVATLPIALMAFERFVFYILNYIQFSVQQPLGPVTSIIARREFQEDGSLGNKPHVHIGITVDPSESPFISSQRIRALPNQVFNKDIKTDYESMLANKWVTNFEEYLSIQTLFTDLHKHDCEGTGRSKRINFQGKRKDVKCRVPHFPNSFDYDFKAHSNLYSDETLLLFKKYGLAYTPTVANRCTQTEIAEGKPIPIDELRGGKVTYPCHKSEQHSPTVPLLFLCSLSATNVQLCDFRFQMAYLFKYSVGKEHHRETELSVKPGTTANNLVNVGVINQYNQKSGGQSVFMKDTDPDDWQREIGDAETTFVLLNCCYISSTMRAIHVPTLTPENRSVLLKYPRKIKRNDFGDSDPPSVKLLRDLQDVRQKFTDNQLLTIEDYYISNTGLDKIQAFSIRPPILRSFDMLEIYSKCFSSSGVPPKSNFVCPISSPWVDGANRSIKIRICHLSLAVSYLKSIKNKKFQQKNSFHPKWLLNNILLKLEKEYDEKSKSKAPFSKWFKRFVDLNETTPIAIVFPKVRVEDNANFLYHLLLINSRFVSELDLVSNANWKKAFTLGNVMPETPSAIDILNLTRKYITDHLIFQPISTGAFSRTIKQLDKLLPEFFLENKISYVGQPLILTRSIRQKFSDDFNNMVKTHQFNLACCLKKLCTVEGDDAIIHSNIPTVDDILNGQAKSWNPIVPRKINQSDESFDEQRNAFQILRKAIDRYKTSQKTFEPSLFATGPPGSGKTFLMCLTLLYAMSRQLTVAVFALTALRARDLGGLHLHDLFLFRDFGSTNYSSTSIAENTLLHLQKFPEKRDFLKTIDIILCEENGLISAEQFSAVEKILRHLKGNPFVPFGGAMFLSTGDPQQLPPVKGKPIWLSSLMYTVFQVINLKHFVRSAGDQNLQNILSLLQLPNLSESQIDEIVSVFSTNLTDANFISSIGEIPPYYDVVFAKKEAVSEATKILTNREKESIVEWNRNHAANDQKIFFISHANDEFEKSPGDWRQVIDLPNVTKQISKCMRESSELFLYEGGIMRLTYNGKTPKGFVFSQGQLAVITSIVFSKQNPAADPIITVALVPSQVNNLQNLTVNSNWPTFTINKRITEPLMVFDKSASFRVQRKQYPLVYAAVTTIHKAMGRTCKFVCTKISHTKGPYQIWQKQLFYVLVSRIEYLQNLLFVGNKQECLETIRHILHFRDRTTEYIAKMLIHLNILSSSVSTDPNFTISNFKPAEYKVACVYLIVSSKKPNYWKVGQTENFSRRLSQHNSVQGGSRGTREISLKPFVPGAMITGFHSEQKQMRLEIENEWHNLINLKPNLTTIEVLYLGEEALANVKSVNQSNSHFATLKFNSFLHR